MVPSKYTAAGDRSGGPSDSKEGATVCAVYWLELCCVWALSSDTIVARKYNVRVPLTHLIPDILITDLPDELKVERGAFQFDETTAVHLGHGGFGKAVLTTHPPPTLPPPSPTLPPPSPTLPHPLPTLPHPPPTLPPPSPHPPSSSPHLRWDYARPSSFRFCVPWTLQREQCSR